MDALSPGRDLDQYIHTVNSFHMLDAEEERALARRLHDEGDLDAALREALNARRRGRWWGPAGVADILTTAFLCARRHRCVRIGRRG